MIDSIKEKFMESVWVYNCDEERTIVKDIWQFSHSFNEYTPKAWQSQWE